MESLDSWFGYGDGRWETVTFLSDRTVWVHFSSCNLENRDTVLDMEKVVFGNALGVIMGWGPWLFALKRSSSPRLSPGLVFLRGSPPSWDAHMWLFSISIPASHRLGQKDTRSLLAVCLYLRKSGYQHESALVCYIQVSNIFVRIKPQREIHSLHEKYQPVLCSLQDAGVKHPTLRMRSTALLELLAK